jgi:hypothetical protein
VEEARAAMGIDWMIGRELAQAIPPAYTRWMGQQMLSQMAEQQLDAATRHKLFYKAEE